MQAAPLVYRGIINWSAIESVIQVGLLGFSSIVESHRLMLIKHVNHV